MKVLLFTENSYSGGLDTFVVNLVNKWPNETDEIVLVCNRSHPGLAVIAKRVRRQLRLVSHDMTLLWVLLKRLESANAPLILRKILSAVLRYPFFLYYVVATSRLMKAHSADRLMVVNGGYPGGDTCRAAAIAWSIFGLGPNPIMNIHNLAVPAQLWQWFPEWLIDKLIVRTCAHIVTVSIACCKSLRVRSPFVAAGDFVQVIYNGIEIPRASPSDTNTVRQELHIPDDAFVFLMLATYEPRKGHDYLFRAFATLLSARPEGFLLICGYGQPAERDRVRDLSVQNGVDHRVILCGFRDDVADLISASDSMVIPSQRFESFGLTAVEAMASGKPVIATDVGGLPEVLDDGRAGLLADPNDADQFAEVMGRVIAEPNTRNEIVRNGRLRIAEVFRASRMSADYEMMIRRAGIAQSE